MFGAEFSLRIPRLEMKSELRGTALVSLAAMLRIAAREISALLTRGGLIGVRKPGSAAIGSVGQLGRGFSVSSDRARNTA